MNSESDLELTLYRSFYYPVYTEVKQRKRLINKSLFLTTIYKGRNELITLLDKYAVLEDTINHEHLKLLKEANWIQEGNTFGTWIISLKGIWESETKRDVINSEILIDYINQKKLQQKSRRGKSLTDGEKIYLFTMIAMRSFSENTPFSRELDNHAVVLDALEKSLVFLKKHDVIKPSYELPEAGSGENRLSHLLRSPSESIPSKTGYLFKRANKRRACYLNVYNEETNTLSKDDIGYLIWKIFERDPSIEEENEIVSFCEILLLEKLSQFYDRTVTKDFPFTRTEHLHIIRDSVERISYKLPLWQLSDKK